MHLVDVEVQGFRGYAEATRISLNDLTVLCGRNDAGKSSMFHALQIFLDEGAKPSPADFTVGLEPRIQVTCRFSGFPTNVVVDESHSTTLEAEHLLDEDGLLAIRKVWAKSSTKPEIFAVALHPHHEEHPPLIELKQAELKKIAQDLGVTSEVTDKRSNSEYRRAIWDAWARNQAAPKLATEVALNKEDGRRLSSFLSDYMPLFHLFEADRLGNDSDKVAQDPAKLVVKSVLEAHTQQLAQLTTTVETKVQELLGDVVARLHEISPELSTSLQPVDLKPDWSKAFSALKFVDENGVPLAGRGSGTRRLVLLSFFRAEAERGYEDDETWRRGVIIAVEEPETALHPDMQRETLAALSEVSALPNRQVLLTTHSSNLARDIPIDSIRFADTSGEVTQWISNIDVSDADLLRHMHTTMGTLSDHNVRCFILVEGLNDIDGLKNLSKSVQAAGAVAPDLVDEDARGRVCFVPIGGSGQTALWESRLSRFARDEVHILDSDRQSPGSPLKPTVQKHVDKYSESSAGHVEVHVLERRELENYLTPASIVEAYGTIIPEGNLEKFSQALEAKHTSQSEWNHLDIPEYVASLVHSCSSSEKPWEELPEDKRKRKESNVKKHLVHAFAHPSVGKSLNEEEQDPLLGLMVLLEHKLTNQERPSEN